MANSTAQELRVIRITEVTPPAPPCFGSRGAWLEYILAADMAHKENENPGAGPMVSRSPDSKFNPEFAFCRDCSKQYQAEMDRERKCQPTWLHALRQPVPAEDIAA